MKENITLAGALGILSVIIIPILIWSVSIETRLTMHQQKIESVEEINNRMNKKLDEMNTNLIKILVKLERKQDIRVYKTEK